MTNIKNIINSLVLAGVLICTPLFVYGAQASEEDVKVAEVNVAEAELKVKVAEDEVKSAEAKVKAAEAKVKKIQNELSSLEKEEETLARNFSYSSCEALAHNEELAKYYNECLRNFRTGASFSGMKSDFQAKRQSKINDLKNAQQQVQKAKQELTQAKQELTQAERELERAKNDLIMEASKNLGISAEAVTEDPGLAGIDEREELLSKAAEESLDAKEAALDKAKKDMEAAVKSKEKEYDDEIAAIRARDCENAPDKAECQAQKALDLATKENEKARAVAAITAEQQKNVDAAQKAYDDRYEYLEKLGAAADKQAKKDLKAAEKAYKDNVKLIEKCEKNPKAKGCDKVDEAKTAVASYEKNNPQSEAVLKQENKVREQELKEYNKAKNAVEDAQKKMNKYCGGEGKKDEARCNAAKEAMAEALKTTNAYEEKVAAAEAAVKATNDAAAKKRAEEERIATEQQTIAEATAAEKRKTDANKAKQKEAEAKTEYEKKAEELQKAQRECASGKSESCDKIDELRSEVDKARNAYSKAHEDAQKLGVKEEKIQDGYYLAQQEFNEKSEALEAAKRELKEKEAALAEAKAACEHSKKLTSRQGRTDAEKYCAQAEKLEAEVENIKNDVETKAADFRLAKEDLAFARKEAFPHENQDYLGFSVDNPDSMYKNTNDVFKTVTRRAAFILYHLKPVIYMFAGFGLIGFAFAAIFNKINWKWFGNLAIGLFLVANTGRLVEYMVFPSKGGTDYMELEKVGVLNSFGDKITLSQALGDAQYAWVDNTYYVPSYSPTVENNAPTSEEVPAGSEEEKEEARKFCEAETKGGGLFGGGSFTSCVKDIISAGKKAADTVKQAQSTVDAVRSTVNTVVNAAQNIGDAAKSMGQNIKEGDIAGAFQDIAAIGGNVRDAVNASGSMMSFANESMSAISNNIQDMGKSTAQVAELNSLRASGEATNKFDAALKGQKIGEDGRAERLWNGEIASDKKSGVNNGQSGFMDVVDQVTGDANAVAGAVVDGASTVSDFAGSVQNFGVPNKVIDSKFYGKTPTINDVINKNRNSR